MADNTDPKSRKAALVQTYTQRTEPSEMARQAQAVRSAVFSDTPEITGSREAINSKIQELYDYDKNIGARYRDPSNEMFIENPMARWQAEEARKGAVSGEIGDLFSRLGRYQDLYGNVVERGLETWEKSMDHLWKMIQVEQQNIENELDEKKLAQAGATKTSDNAFLQKLNQAAQSIIGATGTGKEKIQDEINNIQGVLNLKKSKVGLLGGLIGGARETEEPAGSPETRAKLEARLKELQGQLTKSETGESANSAIQQLAQEAMSQRPDLRTDIAGILSLFAQEGPSQAELSSSATQQLISELTSAAQGGQEISKVTMIQKYVPPLSINEVNSIFEAFGG